MADIGVVHEAISAGGGAEAVAVHTIEALADSGHSVTLYTTDRANVESLNRRYGTALSAALDIVRVDAKPISAVNALAFATRPLGVSDMPLLRQAVFERIVRRRYRTRHDGLVCTHGEFAVDGAVEYIHFPYFSERAMRTYESRFDEALYPQYHRLCRAVKRRPETSEQTTVTNSAWTAGVIEETLGREAAVVHPPVETGAFDPPDWAEMESGFVALGRVHPLKRQHLLVDIVDGLRASGVETHLHVVGPVGDEAYYERLAELAADRPYVSLEGELPRDELVSMLETHRYGLHGRRFEHFGIAVAEMVAAGSLPFVHESGGQREVVAGEPDLCYADRDDAVETAARVLQSPARQTALRETLAARREAYSVERFREEMLGVIEGTLDQ